MMPVLQEQIEMVEHGKHRSRHRPERNHRDLPAIPNADQPEQKGVSYYGGHRQLKAIEEPLKRIFHLRQYSFDEADRVFSANSLRRDDIGNRTEADARRAVVGAD